MKSQQKDSNITTSCKNCVFAIYDGDGCTQYDCAAGRIDVFTEKGRLIDAFDNDKSFYLIEGLCNFYREEDWITDKDNPVEEVKREAFPTFGIVIYNLSEDTNKQLDTLKDIIDESPITNKNVYVVLITNNQSKPDMPYFLPMVEKFKGIDVDLKIVSVFDDVPKNHIDALAFKNVINRDYLIKIDNNDMLSTDAFNEVNESLNTKLEKISYYQDNSISIIPAFLVNHTYHKFNDYHLLEKEVCKLAKKKRHYKNIGK